MSSNEALSCLRELAGANVYQPRAEPAQVQILGLLETSGLHFDHMWIMSLSDEIWPLPPRPSPFLPRRCSGGSVFPTQPASANFSSPVRPPRASARVRDRSPGATPNRRRTHRYAPAPCCLRAAGKKSPRGSPRAPRRWLTSVPRSIDCPTRLSRTRRNLARRLGNSARFLRLPVQSLRTLPPPGAPAARNPARSRCRGARRGRAQRSPSPLARTRIECAALRRHGSGAACSPCRRRGSRAESNPQCSAGAPLPRPRTGAARAPPGLVARYRTAARPISKSPRSSTRRR